MTGKEVMNEILSDIRHFLVSVFVIAASFVVIGMSIFAATALIYFAIEHPIAGGAIVLTIIALLTKLR